MGHGTTYHASPRFALAIAILARPAYGQDMRRGELFSCTFELNSTDGLFLKAVGRCRHVFDDTNKRIVTEFQFPNETVAIYNPKLRMRWSGGEISEPVEILTIAVPPGYPAQFRFLSD